MVPFQTQLSISFSQAELWIINGFGNVIILWQYGHYYNGVHVYIIIICRQ